MEQEAPTATEVVDPETGEVTTAEEVAGALVASMDPSAPSPHEVPAELQQELDEALSELSEAQSEHELAKEAAKDAKAQMEHAQIQLARVARKVSDALAGRKPIETPAMFDDDGTPTAEAAADPVTGVLSPETAAKELAVLGLSESIVGKLNEAHIFTLGELQKRMTSAGEWWAKDIPGIGGERAGTIADAYNECVWGVNPQGDNPGDEAGTKKGHKEP